MIDVSKLPAHIGLILLLIERRGGSVDEEQIKKESPFSERTLDNYIPKIIKRGVSKTVIIEQNQRKVFFHFLNRGSCPLNRRNQLLRISRQ